MLRYAFQLEAEADRVESAVAAVLAAGHRTADLAKPGQTALSTSAMGDKIVAAVRDGARVNKRAASRESASALSTELPRA